MGKKVISEAVAMTCPYILIVVSSGPPLDPGGLTDSNPTVQKDPNGAHNSAQVDRNF
jgi:hypothetical protein